MKTLLTQKKYSRAIVHYSAHYLQSLWLGILPLLLAFQLSWAQSYTPLYDNGSFNSRMLNVNLAVGATAGEAGVSPVGGGTYTIPIAAPPGTNGVTPSVALAYNSMGGNGLVGMGWSISGLSMISRVPRSIYQDGAAGSVELNADDRFTLDGVRLVATSGTYGANLATYATESETFAKITSYDLTGVGGTGWFKVEAKDGTIMEYGTDANSRRQLNYGDPSVFWLLKKIKYPDGNYIEFNYTGNYEPKIDEINYTGNSNTGLAPYNKIKFDYTSRSDGNVAYEAGVFLNTEFLLDKITVTAEGQTVRTYQLNYGFDNINSYLKQITEKGSDGSELNATIFKYGDIPTGFTPDNTSLNLGSLINSISSGDFDADGYTDILIANVDYVSGIEYNTGFQIYKRTAGNTTYSQSLNVPLTTKIQVINKTKIPNFYQFLSSDFTGDGVDDIAVSNLVFSGSNRTVDSWKIYKIRDNATAYDEIALLPYSNYNQVHSSGNYVFPGDFNGDGIQDILSVLGWNNSYASHIYFGRSSTCDPNSTCFGTVALTGSYSLGFDHWAAADKVYVLDFNGDGKSDLMVIKGSQCEIFTFEGAGYSGRRIYSGSFPTKDHLIYLGDFNGDRKTDLLVRASLTNNGATWSKALSNGLTFITSNFSFQQQPDIYNNDPTNDHITIADFNGDGKTDIYHGWGYNSNSSRLDVYYSQGVSFYYLQHVHSGYLGGGGSLPFDLNGDGRSDLINRISIWDPSAIFYFRKEGKENLLEKVANGHGHVTEWNYKRLSEAGSFYNQNGLGTDPFNHIQIPMYAVSDFKSQNGIGGISSIQYAYEEARIHKKGKGFLGFKKTTAANLTMNTKTVVETQFNTYPLATAIYKTGTYLLPNTLLSETTFTNEFVAYGSSSFDPNKRYWQRVNGTNENNAFEGRTLTTSNTYDPYGNVTTGTVNNNNGLETTTTTAIFNGLYATPVPAKPTSVTVSRTRSGQSAYSVTTTYAYNGIGQLTSKTDFSGQSQSVTTDYEYNNNLGNLTKTTVTPNGMTARITSSTYDTKGRYALSTTNPLSQTTTATYDPKWGKPLSGQGIDGLTTTYEYDVFGRTKKTHLPEGYSITQSYGWDISNGAIYYTLLDHPGKPNVKTWYDVLGREIKSETDAFGSGVITQAKTYDAKGNVATSTQPYKTGETVLTTTTTYDTYNRPTSISTSQSSFGTTTIGYAYNAGNLTVTTTNPAGQVASKTTDATGQTISATDHGGTLTYAYNSQGNLLTVVKDGATLTSSQYDAYGRQTQLTDQNAGTTTYAYDALGQLTSQTNANGNLTTMAYDVMGRIITRTGVEGTTTHEYFANGNGAATGQLKKITSFAGNTEEYTYDSYGRLSTTTETVDATAHATSYSYNMYGDVTAKTFPSGFGIIQAYDANGYLTQIKNANNTPLYTNNGLSGLGVNTNYALGNGKTSAVNHFFGIPTQYSTAGVQDLLLTWNYMSGNLTQRKDNIKGREENFTYDNLNRLSSAQVVGQAALTMNYGNIGNIDFKTDAGAYTYHPTKPNAVTFVTNPQSVVPSLQQHISYTAFAQPAGLVENSYALTYTYGSDYNRLRAITQQNGSEINRRYYFGDYEKDITGSTTRHLHYISSPAGLIAIVVRESGSDTYYYTYTDHLGSILTVTSDNGTVVGEQSFDAWGRYRDVNTWVPLTTPPSGVGGLGWLTRGYTGHEHLRPFGLINMNGRLYDPALGRVLSADNYVQDPFFTQNYNRYTYAYNNPLIYNDPDGQVVFLAAVAIGAIISASTYTVGVMMSPGGFHTNWSWKSFGLSALQGAVAGGISFGIGAAFPIGGMGFEGAFSNMLAHGVAGAGQTALFGGDAGQGFISGFVSSGFSIGAARFGAGAIGQIATGGLSSGVSSSIAGGNFWEGFGKGVIVAGLNHFLHQPHPRRNRSPQPLTDSERKELKNKILADGELNLGEANDWWRNGNGGDLEVDANKVAIGNVNVADFPNGIGSTISKQTLFLRNGRVYGQITLQLQKGNRIQILRDQYNFEMHSWNLGNTFRNFATMSGASTAGNGGNSFWINFRGTISIPQR